MRKILAVIWLVVAVVSGIFSLKGGDTSILAGWVFLVWTAPFGVIWWFYLYDAALMIMPTRIAEPIGVTLTIVVGFLFWFVLVPAVSRYSRRPRKSPKAPVDKG